MEKVSVKNKVLEYVTRHLDQYGYAPSYREIGKAVGLRSSSSVHKYVNMLVDEGKLNLKSKQSRAITAHRKVGMNKHQPDVPQRVRLELADGGIVYFDCNIENDDPDELIIAFSGIFDGSQIKNGVGRIVACGIEE